MHSFARPVAIISLAVFSALGGPNTASGASPTAGLAQPSVRAAADQETGAISGRIVDADGNGLAGVAVWIADDLESLPSFSAFTGPDGSYLVEQMAASPAGYVVCFDGRGASGSSMTGYVSRCYRSSVWDLYEPYDNDGVRPPTEAELVPVTAGELTRLADVVLGAAGAASGTVTDAVSGAAVVDAFVFSFKVPAVSTAADGTYLITGLDPELGPFDVCVDSTPYARQCHQSTPWFEIPTGDPVSVSAGSTTDGVDVALQLPGSIAGTVTSATDGAGVPEVRVTAFTGEGIAIATGSSRTDGSYLITDLLPSASGYLLCFDASSAVLGTSLYGYASQCRSNRPWVPGEPPPSAASELVPVSAESITRGIDAALEPGAAISGTVTSADNGSGVEAVGVSVFDSSGNLARTGTTAADGTYTVAGLVPDVLYRICFDASPVPIDASAGFLSECFSGQPWSDETGPPPAGSTPVQATVGLTAGIDAALRPAAGITGTVTSVSGVAVGGVNVMVLSGDGSLFAATTNADGGYVIPRLKPATDEYVVCFNAQGAIDVDAPFGLQSQCFDGQPWEPTDVPPAGAVTVSVAPETVSPDVDAVLQPAGGISGTVTAAVGGQTLADVYVYAFDEAGQVPSSTVTAADGSYTLTLLTPSATGYIVCFSPGASTGADSAGHLNQCYDGQPWAADASPPDEATPVPVSAGQTTSGIDAAVRPAAGIAGIVTSATDGAGLQGVNVQLLNAAGEHLSDATTTADGSYVIPQVQPGTYVVCFGPALDPTDILPAGFAGECYDDVPRAGPEPAGGVTPVVVTAETVTGGIDASLAPAAGIAGTVISEIDGAALVDVNVTAWDENLDQVQSVLTNSDGGYTLPLLPPSAAGYLVCFEQLTAECFDDEAWFPGTAFPTDAKRIPVTTGTLTHGIDAALPGTAGITGTVTAKADGSGLGGVMVLALDLSGRTVGSVESATDGSYTLPLPDRWTDRFLVCFDATAGTGGPAPAGYRSECFDGITWDPGSVAPLDADPVVIVGEEITTGVNAALESWSS